MYLSGSLKEPVAGLSEKVMNFNIDTCRGIFRLSEELLGFEEWLYTMQLLFFYFFFLS
jgi:hypothetical protein